MSIEHTPQHNLDPSSRSKIPNVTPETIDAFDRDMKDLGADFRKVALDAIQEEQPDLLNRILEYIAAIGRRGENPQEAAFDTLLLAYGLLRKQEQADKLASQFSLDETKQEG